MSDSPTDSKARKFYDPMDDILDRPIAYNPAFKRITGSTVAGIFLSQSWYWSKRHRQDQGWFFKTGVEWEEETGLTRTEQETARKHCLRVGVMQEKLKGVPATMYYRVNKPRVYELLGVQFAGFPQTEIAEDPQTGLQEPDEPDSGIPANINKEPETPPMIPPENEYLRIIRANARVHWGKSMAAWRRVEASLEKAIWERSDHSVVIKGVGDVAEVFQDRYAKTFEQDLLGGLNEKVTVIFEA